MTLKIEDRGKVWLRGDRCPHHAVRVGVKIYVTADGGAGGTVVAAVAGECLLVDIHDPERSMRQLRRMPLDLEGDASGTLFSGFENTRHGDVSVITFRHPAVSERLLEGERYGKIDHAAMTIEDLARLAEGRD